LLVANHPNGLLDPALVWATAGRDVRFLAKSTLFKGPLAPLMRAAGAIPVYRRVDVGEDPSRNAEMFAGVELALARGDAVCLFPEGTSHSKGRLEQLRTGAARIALASAAAGASLAIVPVGLTFDRKARFRSRATVAYGPTFGCDDLVADYQDDAKGAVRALTERIAVHLRALIVEADPRSFEEIVARIDRLYAAARGLDRDPKSRLERRRGIAEALERLRVEDPGQVEDILQRVRAYDAERFRFGLRERDVDAAVPLATLVWFAVRESGYAAVLVPIALLGAVVFAVPYLITDLLARREAALEVQASTKVIGGFAIYAIWILLLSVLIGIGWGAWSGLGSLIGLPLLALAALFAIERELTVAATIRASLATRRVPTDVRRRISRRRSAIAEVLDRVYEWLKQDSRGVAS
jgi:1-acyl-sn-glycerol-3-phosphate acyltransferase